ncbi:MAG: phage portal protein, partial [Rhodospirillaceae bacterium]|nr:phage portal protein [Rhodospirillaceae bacterium]
SKIRAEAIGVSPERAEELQRQAETIWETWGPLAGADDRLSFDEIQFLAIRKIIEDGEVFAIPTWANDPWRTLGRVIELAESDRCISENQGFEQGIKLGDRGQPIAYSFSKPNLKETLKVEYKEIPARDKNGRPQVLHVFPPKRVGQLRGVPFFAPAMSFFKHLADYLEAEVVAARVAACLAIFITNADPLGMAASQAGSTRAADGSRVQGIEPGLVHYLNVGESINVVDPKRPGDAFAPFVEGVLRLIGVSLGMPYELLLKDFSKTNYSSARAALLEGRRHFMNWRTWFSKKFCQPIWELVLEEAYLRGHFDAPDFYKFRQELCRCSWIGGGWGWVDPVKEVEASKLAMDYGLSTLAEEAAGQGRDWEEVLEQKAREDRKAKELGLDLSAQPKAKTPPPDEPEEGDKQNAKD